MKRRIISILLALLLVMGVCPTSVFAANEDFVIGNGVLTKYNGLGGEMVIPDGVTSINDCAFDTCEKFTNVIVSDDSVSSEIEIDSDSQIRTASNDAIMASGTCGENLDWTLDKKGILTISGKGKMDNYIYSAPESSENPHAPWYPKNDDITTVIIENGVTSIGSYAFHYCERISNIIIPDSVTEIGYYAFHHCSSLSNIVIPDSVTIINGYAFCNCNNLHSAVLSKKLGKISTALFRECTNIKDLVIPESVTSIEEDAFFRCYGLKSIFIPKTVTKIDIYAFPHHTYPNPSVVYYGGSEKQWKALTSRIHSSSLNSAIIHYDCTKPAQTLQGIIPIGDRVSFKGHTYQLFYSSYGYDEIEAYLESTGGYLACLTSKEEDEFAYRYVQNCGKDSAVFGFSDNEQEGVWKWECGEKTEYTNWASGEPNNEFGGENWACYESGTGKWNDGHYPSECYYLCEWLPKLGEITLRTDKNSLTIDEELPIVATIHTPDGFSESDITWTSSDESIAIVTPSGALIADYTSATALVKGVAPGEVTITVTLADGRRAQYTLTITNSTKSKNYIIERVKSYTSDEIHDQWTNIMESNDSDEIKAERLVELFLHNGFTDPREGVAYLSQVSADRLDYIMLTSNECYSAYQYYNWLYNTASGKAALALLWADGLIFNNELSTWTNPLTYTGEKDLPGVAKYKDMLYDFMNATSFDIELMQYISSISKLAKNATSGGDMYAQKLIGELNDCKNSGEILQRMQESNPSAKGLYLSLKKSSENDSGLSFKLDETSGFGKFSKAMGYSGKIISTADASVSFAVDLLTLDSKLAVYEQYRDFLQEVMTSSDLPWELSLAAYSVLQEMEDGAYGEIKDFAITLIEQTGVTQIITDSVWTKLLGEVGASTFTGYLSLIEIESWCINKIVDVGAMVKEVGCIVGYAKLQLHFVRKLEESKSTFLKNQTEETAWDFFENYNLLYQLRSEGEKAVQELYKIDGFASYFTDFGHSETIEKINLILQKLENCRFTVDENIEIPKSVKYVSKAVIRCPVNVEIFAPNGDYITTLVDGVESDVTNEYGRFAVVYQVCSNDYAKVICFSNEGDYTIKLVGVDDGSVDFDFARSVGNNSELYGFSKVGVSQDTVIQTSINQIVYSHDYDIDFDGDGVFENNGTFQKIESIATPSFTDIKSTAYYYDAVIWAVRNGITSGTSATSFSPDASCTRGQIVTFLWRNAGRPDPKTSSNPFADVKSTDYYYKAVLWAVENNITSGVGKGKFAPSQPCTRGQAVTFLWRAAGRPGVTNTDNSFTDVKPGSYYGSAVNWAVVSKITSGTSVTTFGPEQPCTRGQIVTFLYRAKG